jgi:AraC family transcriptional regulator
MQGQTNVQRQHSTYFPPTILQPTRKKRGNSQNVLRLAPAQAPVSDLSVIYPEAVVVSSEPLGWQNLRAIHLRQQSGWAMPPLENHCIIIQLDPAVSVTAQIGRSKFEQTVQPGDVIIVPAGSSMQWRQDVDTNDALHLYLHPHVLRTTAESVDFDTTQILQPQFGVRDEQIQHIALSLLCELQEANVIGRIYADSLAQLLAMQLVRRYSERRKDPHVSRGGMAPGKLRKAIEFMNANLDKEHTVALGAVAEEVHMSYFHFSRAFKQSTGVSPNVYMIEQRIERAKKLLTETDRPIAEIALRVGFASQSHFTTTFRRLAWATPKSFREMA